MAKTRTRSSMMCVIYCRQSVTRQGEDSVRLAMQEDILRDLAASKGLAISEPPLHDPDTKV